MQLLQLHLESAPRVPTVPPEPLVPPLLEPQLAVAFQFEYSGPFFFGAVTVVNPIVLVVVKGPILQECDCALGSGYFIDV